MKKKTMPSQKWQKTLFCCISPLGSAYLLRKAMRKRPASRDATLERCDGRMTANNDRNNPKMACFCIGDGRTGDMVQTGEALSAADQEPTPLPPGAQDLHDTFKWHEVFLKEIRDMGMEETFRDNLRGSTIVASSVFSGIECHKVAFAQLLHAAQLGSLQHYSACDCDPECRQVIRNGHGVARTQHIFADVLDRLPRPVWQSCERMVKNQLSEYEVRRAEGDAHGAIVAEVGQRLLHDLFNHISAQHLLQRGWCVADGQRAVWARVRPKTSVGELEFHFAGFPCTSWGTRGKMFDLLHMSTVPLATVLVDITQNPVDIGIYECTPRFASSGISDIEAVAATYHIQKVFTSPTDFGHPHRRRRCFMVFVNKKRRAVLGDIGDFHKKCMRQVVASGTMYFCAGDDLVLAAKSSQAKKRCRSMQLPWEMLLTPSESIRLRELKAECLRRYGTARGVITMLDQNASHESSGTTMPCLTRNCQPWSFSHGRVLVAHEHLVVQGFPVFPDLQERCGAEMPFDAHVISPFRLKAMAGNGQSAVCMGFLISWALAFTTKVHE